MGKVRVSLAGECYTEKQLKSLNEAYEVINVKKDATLVSGYAEGIESINKYDSDNYFDLNTDLMLDAIDQSDVCVLMVPTVSAASTRSGSSHSSLGWIMGYCWSQGVPVVLLELGKAIDLTVRGIRPLADKSVQAHLSTLDQLSNYDFTEMQYV